MMQDKTLSQTPQESNVNYTSTFQADLFYTTDTAPADLADYFTDRSTTGSNSPVNSRLSQAVVEPRYCGIYRYTANMTGKRRAYDGVLTRIDDGYTLAFQRRWIVQRGAHYQLIDFSYPTEHKDGFVSLLFPVRGNVSAYTFKYDRRYRVERISEELYKIEVL